MGSVGQVMTDEQLETLRRQISVYSTICQQLVEMHKASVSQQAALPGELLSFLGTWRSGYIFYVRNRDVVAHYRRLHGSIQASIPTMFSWDRTRDFTSLSRTLR